LIDVLGNVDIGGEILINCSYIEELNLIIGLLNLFLLIKIIVYSIKLALATLNGLKIAKH